MPAGRPKGTKDPDARRNRLSIPLSDAEKLGLEHTARLIATQRGDPALGVATVAREFLLSEMLLYYQSLLDKKNEHGARQGEATM
jgi:hypothetical protein